MIASHLRTQVSREATFSVGRSFLPDHTPTGGFIIGVYCICDNHIDNIIQFSTKVKSHHRAQESRGIPKIIVTSSHFWLNTFVGMGLRV